MEQKEREEIAKSMIKMGLRLWRNLFLEMLFCFLILLIMLIIGKVSLVYSAAGCFWFSGIWKNERRYLHFPPFISTSVRK